MVDANIEKTAEEIGEELEERDIDLSNLFESSDESLFNLGEFLVDNYQLFAVMGVFGAISIYTTTISTNLQGIDENLINVAVVASLLIFLLVAIQILKRVYGEADFTRFHYTENISLRQFELLLFLISLILLIVVISYIVLSLPRALTLLGAFIAAVAGWQLFGSITNRIPIPHYPNDPLLKGIVRSFLNYVLRLTAVSIILFIIPIALLAYVLVDYGSINILSFLYEYIFVRGQTLLSLALAFFVGMGIASGLSLVGFCDSIYSIYKAIKESEEQSRE